jgi:hypothetical protein
LFMHLLYASSKAVRGACRLRGSKLVIMSSQHVHMCTPSRRNQTRCAPLGAHFLCASK